MQNILTHEFEEKLQKLALPFPTVVTIDNTNGVALL